MTALAVALTLAFAAVLLVKAVADPPTLRAEAILATLRRSAARDPAERGYLRWLRVFALAAALLWAPLILLTAAATVRLFAGLGAIEPEALRWHTLAIGTMLVALGGLIAAPLALIRVWTTERQTHTVEQGHVTDRITRAIEQLGAEKTVKVTEKDADGRPVTLERTEPNLEVRLGAIYALERIAQDSVERDHIPIMETLCAYIRENAPARDVPPLLPADWSERTDRMTPAEVALKGAGFQGRIKLPASLREVMAKRSAIGRLSPPRVDIQAALTVIGRRSAAQIARETRGRRPYRLDLRATRLQRADLREARMEAADLSEARMEAADLREARMEGADLGQAWMEEVDLRGARMEGSKLHSARMERARMGRAWIEGADLRWADLRRATWDGTHVRSLALVADLRDANGLTQAQLDQVIGNEHTLLPNGPSETGEPFHVWTCWETPPENLEDLLERAAPFDEAARARLRSAWVCGPDNPRRRTGTPLALDAPYPKGHPLAQRG